MRNYVICKCAGQAKTSFYLVLNNDEHYLFTQGYRKGVKDYFMKGVTIHDAFDMSKARFDSALMRTMEKIPSYIRYVEKEYGIAVLEKTKKKRKRLAGKFDGGSKSAAHLSFSYT